MQAIRRFIHLVLVQRFAATEICPVKTNQKPVPPGTKKPKYMKTRFLKRSNVMSPVVRLAILSVKSQTGRIKNLHSLPEKEKAA